ncbi:MAG: hypothetical protein FWD25_08915 [Clostridia bacterium]|nr:hypothetical protein [Clostridia bacterium]
MSRIHCADCSSARDSREMRGCTNCGALVCEQCAVRQASMCSDCAGQDEYVMPE